MLADSPRAYWRLGERSGTTAADELLGADGSYLGGAALGAAGALGGDADTAVRLDGTDDRVSMGDPADGRLDAASSDLSVETWLRTTVNGERAIVSKRPSVGPYWQLTVTDDSGHVGGVRVTASDGTVTRQVYGPQVRVDDGRWHHVVVTFDRDGAIAVWVDGIGLATAAPLPGDLGNAGPFLVGKSTGYGYFSGELDEVAFYGSVLPAARIAAHLAAGRP